MRIQPYETVARVRAQLLHILYEIRRENHQFRLRYKGEYLRDAYTIEDYGITDSAILKMVPLSKKIEVSSVSWISLMCYTNIDMDICKLSEEK